MKEDFLCSDLWPLLVEKDQEIISDCFKEEIKKSDQLKISVGFASYDSLKELDRLVEEQNIKNISLILGMYCFGRFPKKLHKLVLEINEKWQKSGIGEIRIVHAFKYHGKLYCFFKNNQIFSAIIGSPNLSFLVDDEATRLNQYEIALFTSNQKILKKTLNHIEKLNSKNVSENIATLEEKHFFSEIKPSKPSSQKFEKISKIGYEKYH